MSRCILNLHDREAQLLGITEWDLDNTDAGGPSSFEANSATTADIELSDVALFSRPETLTGVLEQCPNETQGTWAAV